jgi:hypothetical protein
MVLCGCFVCARYVPGRCCVCCKYTDSFGDEGSQAVAWAIRTNTELTLVWVSGGVVVGRD